MSIELPVKGQTGFEPATLVFGIGNSGRSDDGLGWVFLDWLQQDSQFPGQVEYRYQLQVEDAALVSRAGRVIFVDSYQGTLPGGFQWKSCGRTNDFEFTSHVLPPRAVMYFCRDLYGKSPPADILMIQGSSWGLGTEVSPAAKHHLASALRFFKNKVLS